MLMPSQRAAMTAACRSGVKTHFHGANPWWTGSKAPEQLTGKTAANLLYVPDLIALRYKGAISTWVVDPGPALLAQASAPLDCPARNFLDRDTSNCKGERPTD